jgi:MoxR-like ATPase
MELDELAAASGAMPTGEDCYLPSPELAAAAEVALELGLPLLLTGEPGTGKSTFARHLAERLAPAHFEQMGLNTPAHLPLYTFETKSTSVATDLFYHFDSLRRFHAVHDREMSAHNIDYLTFGALGRAILESLPWKAVSDLVREPNEHHGPRRSVVLIDEVDKAPRDFPNDLLNEIDGMFFRIPELSHNPAKQVRSVSAPRTMRPIVVLTSNSEKNLPAPFLRRCVFHHIRFPDRDNEPGRLAQIVHRNLGIHPSRLSDSAVGFFYDVRELQLEKPPTTAELVEWIRVLHARSRLAGAEDVPSRTVCRLPPGYLKATLGVIGKTPGDLAEIERFAQNWRDPEAEAQ